MQVDDRSTTTFRWLVFLVGVSALRTGIRRLGVHESFVEALDEFPNISAYWRTSLLPLVTAKALGVDSTLDWVVLHLVVTVLLIIGVAFVLLRRFDGETASVMFGLFLIGPIGTILLGGIGFYDVWVIGGAALIVLGKSTPLRILGAITLLGGNFELGCVALIAF